MIKYFRYFLIMFKKMEVDDVIRNIVLTIKKLLDDDDEIMNLTDAVQLAVEEHNIEIWEKAGGLVKEMANKTMTSKTFGFGLYLNPFKTKL